MRITESARRHEVTDEAIRHAVANAVRLIDTDDGVFLVGADTAGRMLELVARLAEDGDLILFTPCRCEP